jgi:hypothetical protein
MDVVGDPSFNHDTLHEQGIVEGIGPAVHAIPLSLFTISIIAANGIVLDVV